MNIKYASLKDLDIISICHIAAFPDSITSKLGVKVVSQMLSWYMSGSNKFLFWVEENEKCIGYCGGYIIDGSDKYGAASGMMQTSFDEIAMALMKKPWLLFHPEILKKATFILRNTLRKLGLKKEKAQQASPTIENMNNPLTAGLIVIGVLPDLQKKGVGSFLQDEFERKSKEMGAKQLQLSVKSQNHTAIKSYKRNGYEIVCQDKSSLGMIKKI